MATTTTISKQLQTLIATYSSSLTDYTNARSVSENEDTDETCINLKATMLTNKAAVDTFIESNITIQNVKALLKLGFL